MHSKMFKYTLFVIFSLINLRCILVSDDNSKDEDLKESIEPKNKVVEKNQIPKNDLALAERLVLPILDAEAKPSDTADKIDIRAVVEESGIRQAYILSSRRVTKWREKDEFDWSQFYLRTLYYFRENLAPRSDTNFSPEYIFSDIKDEKYTEYFDTSKAAEAERAIMTTASPGAIGIRPDLVKSGDTVFVRHVYDNSPARKEGLEQGMRFLSVNDSSVVGDSALRRFSRFSAGDSGTVLDLKVLNKGKVISVVLTKDVVNFPSVIVDTISGIPHIIIFSFSQRSLPGMSTYLEFRQALSHTSKSEITLLDLRGNGGGLVNQALEMLNELIGSGIIIRHWRRDFDKSGIPRLFETNIYAGYAGMATKRNFILLADKSSASAAEIFISALKEARSLPLVGEKTFGKGVGQIFRKTPGGGRIKITNSLFKTRKQNTYHQKGISPTHDSNGRDPLEVAIELAKTQLGKTGNQNNQLSKSVRSEIALSNLVRKQMAPNKIFPIIIED